VKPNELWKERAREEAERDGKTEKEAEQAKPDDKAQYNFTDPDRAS